MAKDIRFEADARGALANGVTKLSDAVKVDDIALQQIYDYDLYLFDLADTVKASVDKVEDAVAANTAVDTSIRELNQIAQECLTALNRRAEVKFGTQNS